MKLNDEELEVLLYFSMLSEETRKNVVEFVSDLSEIDESDDSGGAGFGLDVVEILAEMERTKSAILKAANDEIDRMALAMDELLKVQSGELQYVRARLDDPKKRHRKFDALHKYFKRLTADTITLTFSEIEEIIGSALPKSSGENMYWTRRGRQFIGDCWVSNGYKISELDVAAQVVTFYRAIVLPSG
jgi:DNA-binding transcriptional ArsR family regulator